MQAGWLSDTEKTELLRHLSANRTGVENYAFTARQILEAFSDPQVWILMLNITTSATSAGIGTTYSSTLVSLLGYAPRQAALLNTPGGAVMTISTLVTGLLTRYQIFNRTAAFCLVTSVGLIGSCIIAFVPSPTPLHPTDNRQNLPVLLAGLYLINAQVPVLAIQYAWAGANIAGATKKAIVFSVVQGCFAIGSLIGIQTFQARDIPSGYRPAKIAVVSAQAASLLLALVLFAYYYWQNKKKAKKSPVHDEILAASSAWRGLSDKEDSLFRYSY